MSNETPLTAAEFDERLNAATRRIQQNAQEIEGRNRQLEELIHQKEALLASMQDAWKTFQRERQRIDAEIARLLPAGHS